MEIEEFKSEIRDKKFVWEGSYFKYKFIEGTLNIDGRMTCKYTIVKDRGLLVLDHNNALGTELLVIKRIKTAPVLEFELWNKDSDTFYAKLIDNN